MGSVALLLFLLLFIGGGYYTLRFFAKLAGVDMLAAMAWGFKNKRFELVLNWGLFYLIGSIFLLALLQQPFLQLAMNLTHQGGLLGYAVDSETAELFDPGRMGYVSRRLVPPPAAAGRFDETFELVAVYRPFLADYYQNIELQNIFLSLFFLFLTALGLTLLYLVMYALAGAYAAQTGLAVKPTHRLLRLRFQEITGYRFAPFLGTALLLVFCSSFYGGYRVKQITRDYEEIFGPVRDSFREQIMAKVAPGRTVHGRVIRRMFDYTKIYAHPQSSRKESDRTVATVNYTFEFSGLIDDTPVYLSNTYLGSAETNPNIASLDRYFPPRQSTWNDVILADPLLMAPEVEKELEFRVEEDYSITLIAEGE